MKKTGKGRIEIPIGMRPWPHEMRVAEILASKGHRVEFLLKGRVKTADILLDGVEFEIKSPRTDKANSLEHVLRRALHQSSNIIIDSSRMDVKRISDKQVYRFLINKTRQQRQIKRLLFVMKKGEVVDIKKLV